MIKKLSDHQLRLKEIVSELSESVGQKLFIPPAHFFLNKTEEVANQLLGSYLFRIEIKNRGYDLVGGKIVETEAYLDKNDPASHAATQSITKRNKVFYETGGVSYVFHARSIYYCFNAIVCPKGKAGCVLIRALEPMVGLGIMAQRRSKAVSDIYDLCSGPGKLCQSLNINHLYTGLNLRSSELLVLLPKRRPSIEIASGPRIGISKAVDWPLRFWEKGSRFVSK